MYTINRLDIGSRTRRRARIDTVGGSSTTDSIVANGGGACRSRFYNTIKIGSVGSGVGNSDGADGIVLAIHHIGASNVDGIKISGCGG